MRISRVLCCFALLIPLALPAMAVDSVWRSGFNGGWEINTNWTNNTVPDMGDTAVVSGASSVANVNAAFPDGSNTVGALRIGTSATVNIVSSLTTSGLVDVNGNNFDLDPNAILTGAGNLTVAGQAELGSATLNGTGGTTFQSTVNFNNGGALNVSRSVTTQGTSTWGTLGSLVLSGTSSWTNEGTFNRVQGGTLGTMQLNGTSSFTNASGATFNVSGAQPFVAAGTGTFNNSGTIEVDTTTMNVTGTTFNNLAGGSINLLNNGTFNSANAAITFDAATLGGQGNFNDSAIVQNGGFISPGTSPGTLTVTGNLTVDASTVTIELGGLVQGTEYDLLNVTGAVNLLNTPTIAVQYFGGFTATPGDTFTIFTAGSGLTSGALSFDFSQAGGAAFWDTSASTDTAIVLTSVVPEPSSLALLGLGAFGLAFRRRRS